VHTELQTAVANRTAKRGERVFTTATKQQTDDGIDRENTALVIGSQIVGDRMGALMAWHTTAASAL